MKLTLVEKNKGPLTKIIRHKGGGIEKDSSECWLSAGKATQDDTNLEKLAKGLRKLKPNQALIHGINGHKQINILSEKKYTDQADTITRTKLNFRFVPGEGSAFFDHDPKPGNESYSKEDFLKIMAEVFPAIGEMANVWTPSTSSCIYKDGEQLVGSEGGMHIYFAVKDATDLPRFSEVLFRRLWIAGHGYIFITKDGKQLERTIFDKAVFSPERLDFVSGAVCEDGLEQRLPDPVYTPGNILDTSLLLNLIEDEEVEYQRLVDEAKGKSSTEAVRIRGQYVAFEVEKLVKEGIPQTDAKRIIEKRIGGDLVEGDNLSFDRAGKTTVKQVLKDPEKYDRETLLDPLEPDYGQYKAIFYANIKEGKPVVYSQAHGGRTFFLRHDDNDANKDKIQLEYENGGKKSQATILIEIAFQHELFHDPSGNPYSILTVNGHREVWAINSRTYKDFLQENFYRLTGKGANRNSVTDAISTISSKAKFDGQCRDVALRVARHNGNLYIDLCNPAWQVVEVDGEGWRVVNSPVLFTRTPGMSAFPIPSYSRDISPLWNFLNVSDDDKPLVVGFLLASLYEARSYPALVVVGEQGTAKTTCCRILRKLIDPSTSLMRSPPKDERDFLVACINSRCVALDNLSGVPVWLSDALCRVLTGGAHSARELYSDTGEVLIDILRPVILNGIDDITTRPDLAERSILLALQPIREDQRVEESRLWQDFDEAWPALFGAILHGLSTAIKNIDSIIIDRLPRMADVVKWAVAGESAFNLETDFLTAYRKNQKGSVMTGLENSPVGSALMQLIDMENEWSGTASELLEKLGQFVDEATMKSKVWPKSPAWLSQALRRIGNSLRKAGYEVKQDRDSDNRTITIKRATLEFHCHCRHSVTENDGNDANDDKIGALHVLSGAENQDVGYF